MMRQLEAACGIFIRARRSLLPHYDEQGTRQKRLGFVITEWSEPLHRIPSHRLLAIRRGEPKGSTHAGQGGRGGSHWSPSIPVCHREGAGGSAGGDGL